MPERKWVEDLGEGEGGWKAEPKYMRIKEGVVASKCEPFPCHGRYPAAHRSPSRVRDVRDVPAAANVALPAVRQLCRPHGPPRPFLSLFRACELMA